VAVRPESPHELAERAGIAPSLLSRFRRGERGLTLASVDRLAEVLGLRLVGNGRRRPADAEATVGLATVETDPTASPRPTPPRSARPDRPEGLDAFEEGSCHEIRFAGRLPRLLAGIVGFAGMCDGRSGIGAARHRRSSRRYGFTVARMTARAGSGRSGHASTTALRSGGQVSPE
jgi:transcriptional regulator with XRE-family HTH domain